VHLFKPKWSRQLVAAAVGSMVLLGGLTWAAISMAQAGAPPKATPVQRPVAAQPVAKAPMLMAPVEITAPELVEDELAPLTPVVKAKAPAVKRPRAARTTAAVRTDLAQDPQPEQFEFLEQNVEKPTEELKRPTF
jgi:hypothetical protein